MNDTDHKTPLWIELKTDYIDANFDRLVQYLEQNKTFTEDKFYVETLNLLHKRVAQLIQDLSTKPLYEIDRILQDETGSKKGIIIFYIRLLGIFMLSSACKNPEERRIAFAYQQLLLALVCSSSRTSSVAKYALQTLLGDEVSTLGYNRHELMADSPDMLSERILKQSIVFKKKNTPHVRENIGTAIIENSSLSIYNCSLSETKKGKFNPSLSVADGSIKVFSLSANKLKQSLQSDLDAICSFTETFLEDCRTIVPERKKLLRYDIADRQTIRVRVTGKDLNTIYVETIDPKYEQIKGTLTMNSTFTYSFSDCLKYLPVGYDIEVRLGGITQEGKGVFDMSADFKKYVMEEWINSGEEVLARSLKVNNGNTMWFTETGYVVYTQKNEFEPDLYAWLQVTHINPNGYVYADFIEESKDRFDEQEARKEMMLSFCFEHEDDLPEEEKNKTAVIRTSELAAAAIILYILQRKISVPTERYKMLCAIGILCKISENINSMNFLDFMSQYLRCCIYFVQGKYDKMFSVNVADDISELDVVKRRRLIVEILGNYERPANVQLVDDAIDGDDEMISKLAKLVQSSSRIRGILSESSLNVIKREITKMLSIEDDTATDLDEENGAYFGNEDMSKEFKTSFVFPPNNGMRPAPAKQHQNVFKAVCGFLNSETGGTLYLGVNDLGYAFGIKQDMDFLKFHNIDEYMRHIQDEAKLAFGLDVIMDIQIVPLYNNSVVALQIKPCEHKIVYLDGKAYLRINAETREMDDDMKKRAQAWKMHFNKDTERSKDAIREAIVGKRKVILHGYSSSNGGNCRDRQVEPFAFAKSRKHIWCFDPVDSKNKLFSISRIGNVEILDSKWTRELEHKELSIDLFNMIGTTPTHLSLHLDTMAKNLLVEEFVDADKELVDLNNGYWQLDTDVYSMAGIGRFYIGLADHIEIIQGDELKKYAQDYVKRINW